MKYRLDNTKRKNGKMNKYKKYEQIFLTFFFVESLFETQDHGMLQSMSVCLYGLSAILIGTVARSYGK